MSSRQGDGNSVGVTPTLNMLGLLVATLLMLLAGLSKKRLEWKPRDESKRRSRKPPPGAAT